MAQLRGFVGGSYTLQSVPIDCQRSVNTFPQITESQNQADGGIGASIDAPGKRLLLSVGRGPIRGAYTTSTGIPVVVSGSELYRLTSSWTAVKVGDLLTSTGRVSITDNGTQICLVDGPYGYIVNMAVATFGRITGDWFPGATRVDFLDGYFVFNNPNTGQFFWSDLYDGGTGDPLNFITAEGSPDPVVCTMVNQRQIWVFGAQTTEVWYNSGSDSTFNRIDGAFIEYGCAAPHSPARFANTVLWLGYGQTGQGIVWQSQGYQAKRVSNHGVETAIASYGDITNATAWTYQYEGHAFYILNFPSANASWVYDVSTGQWHERCGLDEFGQFTRDRAEVYTYGYGTHIVGDYENGNIYALDPAVKTDNGAPLKRMRRAPHLSADGKRVFYSKFQLMARMGVGLDGPVADPVVELRYSDDFGNTWTSAGTESLGAIGAYDHRAIWRRLGQSRNRVFEISCSDPVDLTILGADLDAAPGMS